MNAAQKSFTFRRSSSRRAMLALVALVVVTNAGCVGFAANLLYFIGGNKTEARCTALEGKRVAVVCVSGTGVSGSSNEGESLTRVVAALLEKNVKKIEVIRPEDVADWRDTNNWDEIDYRSIGRGVKADRVVAIDLSTFGIHENPTLLRGRASVKVTVYDIADRGKVVFKDGPKEFVFPREGARHSVENESNFLRLYLFQLANDIAKNFYPYDKVEDVASDAAFLHQG